MPKEIIRTPDAPSSPLFSQGVKAGSTLYISGMAGIDPKTNKLAGSTIQDQVRQSLENCRSILRAASGDIGDIVDVQVLLARPEDFAGLNEAYAAFFESDPPARSVSKLGVDVPGMLVSIRMTAHLGD